MAVKIGNRVTVVKEGHRFFGKRGEVVQIGEEGEATCPNPDRPILVDDQIVGGKPQGNCTMREWFTEDELEVG